MTLDLYQASREMADMSRQLAATAEERSRRVRDARMWWKTLGSQFDEVVTRATEPGSNLTWLIGLPDAQPDLVIDADAAPHRHAIIAVDGSQIEMERHGSASFFLINVGWAKISYATGDPAELDSRCRLYYKPQDLFIRLRDGRRTPIRDELLAAIRSEVELERLAELLESIPSDLASLGIVDGNLTAWPLTGLEPELQDAFVQRRMALCDRIMASGHLLAGYISGSQGTDCANLVRVLLCPDRPARCDQCSTRKATGVEACSPVDGLVDAEVVAHGMPTGARTQLFRSTSRILQRYSPDHRVHFFYLNAGDEVARVEIPAWIARDPNRMALVQSLIVDQCARGRGYPPSLVEAHEQAVVTDADRETFAVLLAHRLGDVGIGARQTAKQQSKIRRAI